MSYVIDSHHHFWDPGKGNYPWLEGADVDAIRRVFQPADLRPLLKSAGVDKTIVVQTWSSVEETRDFLALAGRTDFIAGVIGWVDLTAPDVSDTIAGLCAGEHGGFLVGIRHQVHDEPDAGWLLRADVQRGIAALGETGLVYDLLTRPRELPAALALVQKFPELRFVIDHLSKPAIADGELIEWQRRLRPFGDCPNVWCKVSGLVTEANWDTWTAAELKPYIDTAIDIFGTGRLLYGSDWPVSLLAASYQQVKSALEHNIAHLSPAEKAAIMGDNAARVYRLAAHP